MDLSIILLTWNSQDYVEKCVRSVMGSLSGTGIDYEILVVDNGSRDGTPALLDRFSREFPDRFIVESLPENRGTTAPRNLALNKARGEYLCVMDSDVEVSAGVFTEMRSYLSLHPGVGLAVPRIYYPSGMVQKSFDRFPTLLHKVNRFFRLRAMETRQTGGLEAMTEAAEVDYAISAFWFFHRRLVQSVGLLDEKIFYAPEDVDYCLRVWKAGQLIVYLPTVSVVHHTQEISRGWKLNKAKVSHLKGLFYLFIKHRYFFRAPCFQRKPS